MRLQILMQKINTKLLTVYAYGWQKFHVPSFNILIRHEEIPGCCLPVLYDKHIFVL